MSIPLLNRPGSAENAPGHGTGIEVPMQSNYTAAPKHYPGARVCLEGTHIMGTVRRVWMQENTEWQYVITWDDGGPGLTTTAAFLTTNEPVAA